MKSKLGVFVLMFVFVLGGFGLVGAQSVESFFSSLHGQKLDDFNAGLPSSVRNAIGDNVVVSVRELDNGGSSFLVFGGSAPDLSTKRFSIIGENDAIQEVRSGRSLDPKATLRISTTRDVLEGIISNGDNPNSDVDARTLFQDAVARGDIEIEPLTFIGRLLAGVLEIGTSDTGSQIPPVNPTPGEIGDYCDASQVCGQGQCVNNVCINPVPMRGFCTQLGTCVPGAECFIGTGQVGQCIPQWSYDLYGDGYDSSEGGLSPGSQCGGMPIACWGPYECFLNSGAVQHNAQSTACCLYSHYISGSCSNSHDNFT